MDKEIPKSELPKPFRKLSLRVSKSHLPGNASYKGSVVWQRTLSIDDIAARVVDKRSEYRKETLITTFNLLKREIYDAIEEGYNVDFGFGRTELTVNGPFETLYEKFDPDRHTLAPRLRPAPQLKQRVGNLRAVNETYPASLQLDAPPHLRQPPHPTPYVRQRRALQPAPRGRASLHLHLWR
ncbi:hypothetical protein NXX40_23620 [Parabacteroides distasonis]|nr:hypothetical protein [Parabacteroides distasonis]